MRSIIECLYSLFATDRPKRGNADYITLNPVLEYSSFPVLDVKYDVKIPNQVQLVINSHVANFKENIAAIKDRLNASLWLYKRNKSYAEQRASRAEGRDTNVFTLSAINQIPDYQFSVSSSKNGSVMAVTGGCQEATVNCLLKHDLCDAASLPPELKALVPDELNHKIPQEFDTPSM